MIEVRELKKEELASWYANKPKYPLHVHVVTIAGLRGCITGMEQHLCGVGLSWRYQITQSTEHGPISSWWSEADIVQVCSPILNVEAKEDEQEVSGRYLNGLEQVTEFVQQYGEKAMQKYRDRGLMCELRICFWDALREGVD